MKVPIELLVVIVIAVGVAPAYTVGPILDVVATSVLQRGLPEFSLAPWHGFNLAFTMSLVALGGGILVYALRHRIFKLHDRYFPPVSGRNLTESLLHRMFGWSIRVTNGIENGSLQRYLLLLVVSAVVVGARGFPGHLARRARAPAARRIRRPSHSVCSWSWAPSARSCFTASDWSR